MAFVISAAMAGMAGVLFATNFSTVVASKFDINTSILILVFVVLGGLGSMRGSIIAATVFGKFSVALYSGIAIFVSGYVVDAVVYHFDYSKVALIITKKHEQIAAELDRQLDRGATFLQGEGSYTREEMMVVLAAVKRHQVSDLKRLVMEVDPAAFVIVQDAHQVLGDGFSRYSKDSL